MSMELLKKIEALEPQMVETLAGMIEFPAISPTDGGEGEFHKAQYLLKRIKELGFDDVKVYASPDPRAAGGERPNIVLRFPGKGKGRLWIVAHTDVVPEGERSLWESDPFKAVVKDGRIYGRGVNDNGQEVVSSLYALYALKELGLSPEREVCLAFVADEEVGSEYGIRYLIKKGLFSPEDLVVVPDMGNEAADFIEVAEKSICWMEFTVEGKQVHASLPDLGSNACRAANALSFSLDEALRTAFPEEEPLFDPPRSTFEPTRRRANVANINTVPGLEIFAFDCRVLPGVPLAEVKKVVEAEMKKAEARYGVKVSVRFPQCEQAPEPTGADAPVVASLLAALKELFPEVKPKVGGVGGGTCAAFFRREGIPAAVWGQEADCAHMPNEYAVIEHIVNEAKVFALMMLGR
ncbi:MAG: M20 family metallo-hydrolase [Synergistaceae bacterium]|nr:M20 family metallo-hydrolase [Synergistaceae bacterium]